MTSVALAMRPADKREIFASRWEYDPVTLARQVCEWSTVGAVAHGRDMAPIAVINAVMVSPAVINLGMFATDRWPEIARPLSRWCLARFKPLLIATGARRAECWSMVGHRSAHAWLRWFGFRPECEATRGKTGERFVLFGWEPDRDG